MNDDDSPDILEAERGIKRAGKKPLIIATIAGGIVAVVLVFAVAKRAKQQQQKAEEAKQKPHIEDARSAAANLGKGAPKQGPIPAVEPPPTKPAERIRGKASAGLIGETEDATRGLASGLATAPADPALERQRNYDDLRRKMLETAIAAESTVVSMNMPSASNAASKPLAVSEPSVSRPDIPPVPGRPAASGATDPNEQGEKKKFAEAGGAIGYLDATREDPISKYELKAGTVIPAALITGINSDLPGQVKGLVTQNVYDSATGNYLLIPQGSFLVGAYNSEITVGQERVQVVWNRLNFPDGSTLELGSMTGADTGGYSGFNDKVNNHFLRIYKDALMLSLLSAGAQLSQPQAKSANGQLTPGQQITAAMGQQFAETGMETTRKNMNIQPTLEIRPAYRFNVLVNKDIILRPYREN